MTKKISELPVAASVGTIHQAELNQAGVSRSGTLLQIGELEVPTQTATTVVTDNIVENTPSNGVFCNSEFKVDLINSNTVDTTVTIEGCIFETTGTQTTAQFGSSSSFNTLISTFHLQAKRDIFLFIEADTDDVATGDMPFFNITNNANDDMFRLLSENASGDAVLDIGSASGTPDVIVRTGGDYVTAPATGTIPNYSGGGGKVEPIEAMRIKGSNQHVNLASSLYMGTSTIDASAKLQVDSTTQGVLDPRMTTTQRDAISSPASGLRIYNTTTNQWDGFNGTSWVILG